MDSTRSRDVEGCVGGPHDRGSDPENCHYCEAEEAYADHVVTWNCGHPSGCQCERRPMVKVPCGNDTIALCIAASKVRDGRWYKGAATHVFADLLTELKKDGYVLAKEKP